MEFELECCSTDNILADFMSEPLQSKKFVAHRDCIMGIVLIVDSGFSREIVLWHMLQGAHHVSR